MKSTKTKTSMINKPVPDGIIVSVLEFIDVKLLVKMGWCHGRLMMVLRDKEGPSLGMQKPMVLCLF